MHSSKKIVFAFLVITSLGLRGCTSAPDSSSVSLNTPTTQTQTEKVVETSPEVTIQPEVVDANSDTTTAKTYTSERILYDGEHGQRIRGHIEYLTTTLTVDENNIITAVDFVHEGDTPKSRQYQAWFDDAIVDEVVGKSVDEANIGIVGGASNTSEAFNIAIDGLQEKISNA